MGVAERTEEALKKLHLLFAKAQIGTPDGLVLVDKQEAVGQLRELGECVNLMLQESEMTRESRQRGELEQKRSQETIIYNARRSAQDIYAASLMYTDQALTQIQRIIEEAADQMEGVILDMQDRMDYEKEVVHNNQFELRAQLQDLRDTDKYMRLIEEENIRIEREKQSGEFTEEADRPSYADVKPEIHINAAYFKQTGQELPVRDSEDGQKASIVYDGMEELGQKGSDDFREKESESRSGKESVVKNKALEAAKIIGKKARKAAGVDPEAGERTDNARPVSEQGEKAVGLEGQGAKTAGLEEHEKAARQMERKKTAGQVEHEKTARQQEKDEKPSRPQITEEELAQMNGKTGRDYDPKAAGDPFKAASLMEDLDAEYFAWKDQQ